jgi:hypothetical protein
MITITRTTPVRDQFAAAIDAHGANRLATAGKTLNRPRWLIAGHGY